MTQLSIRHYIPETDRGLWDSFVQTSRNGTFLHLRDYMDYHSDRFRDYSLMVEDAGRLVAVMPACAMPDATFCSHAGLTFGGLLIDSRMSQQQVIEAFRLINDLLRKEGFWEVTYKPVPHIYHRIPAEEDLYALFLECNATLISRAPSATIVSGERPPLSRGRKCALRKAERLGVEVCESEDFETFWQILTENLAQRHNAIPVHSLAEIRLLHSRFPDRIRLHLATHEGTIVAGCVMYLFDRVAHTQYISASPLGRELGALDPLINSVIDQYSATHRYFDFGISTESGGRVLNTGLMTQKEGFGARVIVQEAYSYAL